MKTNRSEDIPYESTHPESELEKKLRLYQEVDDLYETLVDNITSSNLDDLTKLFCLLNLRTQWLERLLNDFYDRIAIASTQENPFVFSHIVSSKNAKSFTRKGKTLAFSELTLGGKHKALGIFHYKESPNEDRYIDFLGQLSDFSKDRNSLIHDFFTQNIGTKEKISRLHATTSKLNKLVSATEDRDIMLAKYLFAHMHEYWKST